MASLPSCFIEHGKLRNPEISIYLGESGMFQTMLKPEGVSTRAKRQKSKEVCGLGFHQNPDKRIMVGISIVDCDNIVIYCDNPQLIHVMNISIQWYIVIHCDNPDPEHDEHVNFNKIILAEKNDSRFVGKHLVTSEPGNRTACQIGWISWFYRRWNFNLEQLV